VSSESIAAGSSVSSRAHPEWGRGQVLQVLEHPQGQQAIVEFEVGRIERLPLSELSPAIDPVAALASGRVDSGAAFDLRMFAAALKTEHVRTGALSNARLTPLPHQILLVDKLLSRNLTSHLIGDDVGLGKTVEAGMMYLALAQRDSAERVLIVTPAGLTIQWQEAMQDLFNVTFDVFNFDFFDTRPETWNRYPRVIASIDSLKRNRPRADGQPGRRDVLSEADPWDLVVFDEAHRLSAEETHRGTERTQNYQLADVLRQKCRFFYLLTATPHQGKDDKFRHLLRLVDETASANVFDAPIDGSTLNRLMTRNRKSEVTDVEGKRLFRGHRVIPVDCPLSSDEAGFYRSLVQYLEQGYGTASSMDVVMQHAVGLVMVTFQKLAASSLAAIQHALQKRCVILTSNTRLESPAPAGDIREQDDRFQGEYEEQNPQLEHGAAFFADEVAMLTGLLNQLSQLPRDSKVDRLISEIRRLDELALGQGRQPEHILGFTEYRATQDLIVAALEQEFVAGCCTIIRGGMKLNEKRAAQRRFATNTRFLVSTEAGGEGINLHERSHIMFNFDLPWNPMRIHQRIGRLDRYGQKDEVIAYNLNRTGTIEDRLRHYLDQKLAAIMAALSELEGDRAEDLREAVLGQLDEELDLSKIYVAALRSGGEQQSKAEIDRAMSRIREAAERMSELYGKLDRFDLRAFRQLTSRFTTADVEEFVRHYVEHRGRRLKDHKDGSFSFIVPDEIRRRRFDPKKLDIVVFDQARLSDQPSARLLGFGDELFDGMIADCSTLSFGGHAAVRCVPRLPGISARGGLQFCFLIQKRIAGERPVDWDLWSIFVDEQCQIDDRQGEGLLHVWCHSGGQLPITASSLITKAFELASRRIDERLRELRTNSPEMAGKLTPSELFDARLLCAAVVASEE